MLPTFSRRPLTRFTLAIAFSLASLMLMAPVAKAAGTDNLPAEFSILSNRQGLFEAPAAGDQIYQCVAAGDGYTWRLKGVDAKLLDSDGHVFATQNDIAAFLSVDGSLIDGQVTKSIAAPANVLPDVLLTVTARNPGGMLGQVTEVLRTRAIGGLPPAQACDRDTLRRTVHVPFKADYMFFEPKS